MTGLRREPSTAGVRGRKRWDKRSLNSDDSVSKEPGEGNPKEGAKSHSSKVKGTGSNSTRRVRLN